MTSYDLVQLARRTNTPDGLLDKLMVIITEGKKHGCRKDTVEFALRVIARETIKKASVVTDVVNTFLRRYR